MVVWFGGKRITAVYCLLENMEVYIAKNKFFTGGFFLFMKKKDESSLIVNIILKFLDIQIINSNAPETFKEIFKQSTKRKASQRTYN